MKKERQLAQIACLLHLVTSIYGDTLRMAHVVSFHFFYLLLWYPSFEFTQNHTALQLV